MPAASTNEASDAVPAVVVPKLTAGETVRIDGTGSDAVWSRAASTGPFVDVRTGAKNPSFPAQGSVRLLWDDAHLYVLFEVLDAHLQPGFASPEKEPDHFTVSGQPMLWMRDTAEIMIDPDGDGDNRDYYEIQINPQNLIFSSQFDAYNAPRTLPRGPFGHESWDPALRSAVSLHSGGYTIEAAIPWSAFSKAKRTPPQVGDTWRMNFYAMKSNSGTAWSPILGQGNFHKASRFGRVTWGEKGL